MQSAYLWQLWPGRHWPFTPQEESALVDELRSYEGDPIAFDRGDITAVLNMIRLGINFAAVRIPAPGLQPQRLLSAYTYLESRRLESSNAFEALLANPVLESLNSNSPLARRLVPIPTFWIERAIKSESPTAPAQVADYVQQEVRAMAAAVALEEHKLGDNPPTEGDRCDEFVSIGRVLYNPYDECLWARPFYLPSRVGSLMPPRVADLLGEVS